MSYGPSTRDRRITKTYFRNCSTDMSRSKARLYLYALRLIANHAERTFALLRYSLGGDRPSQTAQLTLSLARIHGIEVRTKACTGWYFKVGSTNSWRSQDQSLPPILRITYLSPISAYSKGSRGLSVLPRVRGIFTTTTISPSRWLRQCSSRYAFHAGRNLPDKELRYLRTVIVTAAVYRGFGRQLLPKG